MRLFRCFLEICITLNLNSFYRPTVVPEFLMIPERILMKEGQNRTVQFDFRWQQIPRLKILWALRQRYIITFNRKCKFT